VPGWIGEEAAAAEVGAKKPGKEKTYAKVTESTEFAEKRIPHFVRNDGGRSIVQGA